ncbi:MAG: AAA family ATPase [Pseudonocardiaceae bacterium]
MSALTVLAVEGLCFAGKTTLVHALAARLGAVAVPEYTDLAVLPPWPPHSRAEVTAALRHFLRVEQQRATLARRTPARLVVLDRSPLTWDVLGLTHSDAVPQPRHPGLIVQHEVENSTSWPKPPADWA